MSKQTVYPLSRWSPPGSQGTYAQTLLTISDLLIVAVIIGIIVLPVSLALAG